MVKFKAEKYRLEFDNEEVRSDLKLLCFATASFVEGRYALPFIMTSVFGEVDVERKSATHDEGRAVDISVKGWTDEEIEAVVAWINTRFSTGVFFDGGLPMQVALFHNIGYGRHIHLQVPRNCRLVFTASDKQIKL